MEKTALKCSVLAAARTRMETTTAELEERIRDLRSVTIGDDNSESASQTESTHGSDVELMNSLGEQLDHIKQDLERLDEIDPKEVMETVQYGAVVHTDKRALLIAASVEEFEVEGMHYLGVTTRAPLIQAMMGKKEGAKIDFNGSKYTIKEIF